MAGGWMDTAKNVGGKIWDFVKSDTGGSLIGGALGGYMASKGDQGAVTMLQTGQSSSGSGSSSTSRSGLPEYLRPYLDAQGGIYPEAQRLYQQNLNQGYIGENADMRNINRNVYNMMQGQYGNQNLLGNMDMARQFGQQYSVGTEGVDPSQARQDLGTLDPTQAMQGILGGQIDTRGLDRLQEAAGNRAMIGYQDMIDDAARGFNQRIAPSIRSNALAAGQYGGSRQGIAEGVAAAESERQLQRNARDLTTANMDIGAQLYGDAYNTARQQQYGAATGLNTQAMQNAQFGKNFGLSANAQNAGMAATGMGLQDQAMQNYLTAMNSGYGALDRTRMEQQQAQAFPWQQLGQYAGIIQRAPVESTSTSSSSSGSQSTSYTPVKGTGMSIAEGIGTGATLGQGVSKLLQ
jgi:hypothetical protein